MSVALQNETERTNRPGSVCGTRVPRVALLVSEFPPGPGGIGTHGYHVASGLAERGWEVLVAANQSYVSTEEIEAFNAAQPFAVSRVRGGRALARPRALLGHVVRFRPDLVVASGRRFAWAGSGIARLVRRPFVAIGHGTEFGAPGLRSAWMTRLAFGGATCVVCVSDFTRARMHDSGVRPRRDVVIVNGADAGVFGRIPRDRVARYRAEAGFGDSRVLLTIGHVSERKGQEVVIRALPEIVRHHPDTLYVMAGIPTLREPLYAIARELGVEASVRFVGAVSTEELLELTNACDLFVMTSRRTARGEMEGFGIAVIEAALCGKPAVVTSGTGLVEAVEVGRTGLAVPENDPSSTARAIVGLLDDRDLLRAMGDAACERARAEFTWSRRVGHYDELFRGMVMA